MEQLFNRLRGLLTRSSRGAAWLLPAVLVLAAGSSAGRAQTVGQTIEDFKIPEYNEKMQLQSMLFGDKALISRAGKVVDITNLKIEYYDLKEAPPPSEDQPAKVDMRITAPVCTYDTRFKTASHEGPVRISSKDMVLTGEDFAFRTDTEHLVVKKNVKVVLRDLRKRSKLTKELSP